MPWPSSPRRRGTPTATGVSGRRRAGRCCPRPRPGGSSRRRRPAPRSTPSPTGSGGWRLDGVKPWCSLAGRLSHALVTAHGSRATAGCSPSSLRDPGVQRSRHGCVACPRAGGRAIRTVRPGPRARGPGGRPGLVPAPARFRLRRHRRGRVLVRRGGGAGAHAARAARAPEPDQLGHLHLGAARRRPGARPGAVAGRGRRRSTPDGRSVAAGELLALARPATRRRRRREVLAAARPCPRPRPAHPGRRRTPAGSPTSPSTCASIMPNGTSPRWAGAVLTGGEPGPR